MISRFTIALPFAVLGMALLAPSSSWKVIPGCSTPLRRFRWARQVHAVPGLTPDAYRPRQLQRTILGQAGVQRFFTTGGRAFCLYSVIGALTNRVVLTARANEVLGSLRVGAVTP